MLKKETGKTPQEYIQEKVIEVAKERVAGTDETVSRIAYSLGFQYPQHFCRQFKRRVGCTPNEYPRPKRSVRDGEAIYGKRKHAGLQDCT